jgi:hypothetical protein
MSAASSARRRPPRSGPHTWKACLASRASRRESSRAIVEARNEQGPPTWAEPGTVRPMIVEEGPGKARPTSAGSWLRAVDGRGQRLERQAHVGWVVAPGAETRNEQLGAGRSWSLKKEPSRSTWAVLGAAHRRSSRHRTSEARPTRWSLRKEPSMPTWAGPLRRARWSSRTALERQAHVGRCSATRGRSPSETVPRAVRRTLEGSASIGNGRRGARSLVARSLVARSMVIAEARNEQLDAGTDGR